MFAAAAAEIADRHLACQRVLDLIRSLEADSLQPLAATCKGLSFIQMYAIYEFAVRSAVQASLADLSRSGVELRSLQRNLLALVLDSHWLSAAGAGRLRVWDSRIAVVTQSTSTTTTAGLRDDLFPNDGTHYRAGQLRTIWRVLGVEAPIVPEMRLLGRIDELVENRNAISHGRRTPEELGGRYSWQELASRVADTNELSTYIVHTLDQHVRSGGLLHNRAHDPAP